MLSGGFTDIPLGAVEAGGTFLLSGLTGTLLADPDGGPPGYQLARPAAEVDVALPAGNVHLSRDGACASVLASPSELEVINAVTGVVTTVPVQPPIDLNVGLFSTWIPGDDAILP